eukprot:134113-Pyramimonas_sp.AAC.1
MRAVRWTNEMRSRNLQSYLLQFRPLQYNQESLDSWYNFKFRPLYFGQSPASCIRGPAGQPGIAGCNAVTTRVKYPVVPGCAK